MTKKLNKKQITMDDLAAMTQRGFDSMHNDIKGVREDIDSVRGELGDFRTDVTKRFREVDRRLDIIEHKLVSAHDRRLDKIEDDMRIIKTALEQKLSVSFPK